MTDKKTKKIEDKKQGVKDKNKYIEAVGRRKTAVARVRIYPAIAKEEVEINGAKLTDYFKLDRLRGAVTAPFKTLNTAFKVTAKVQGGGASAQAEAVRLGLARALETLDEKWRAPLKAAGFLKRDPRMVERKKPGLRKARRPQQWRKR